MTDLTTGYENLTEEELEERKKKVEALNYFTAAYYHKIKPILDKQNLRGFEILYSALSGNKKNDTIIESFLKGFEYGCEVKQSKAELNEFFSLKDEKELFDIRACLEELNLKEENFATIALCAAGKDMAAIGNYMNKQRIKQEQEKYQKAKDIVLDNDEDEEELQVMTLRNNSITIARDAMFLYKNGDPKVYASILAQGLEESCRNYAASNTKNKSLRWAAYAEDALYLLKSDPKLIKESGLTEKQIKIAEKVCQAGRDITIGIQAIEIMADFSLNKKSPTPEQQKVLLDNVSKMQLALYDRPSIVADWNKPVKEEAPSLKA